jgi:hypothetical protein
MKLSVAQMSEITNAYKIGVGLLTEAWIVWWTVLE